MPLLQFTLDQLYKSRKGRQLTHQAYLDIGGVKGALRKHAEATYLSFSSDNHRQLARALFLRLIDPGTVVQDATQRRVAHSDLVLSDPNKAEMLKEVMTTFAGAYLLTTNTVADIPTVELAHEALIREWGRLATWLQEPHTYEDIRLQRQINEDAVAWLRDRQPVDRLYRETQLTKALVWRGRNIPSRAEEVFLQASIAEQKRQRRYTRRKVIGGLVAGAGLIAIGGVIGDLIFSRTPPTFLVYRYRGHTGPVNVAVWSPDGKRVASGSDDMTVQVWNAADGSHPFIYRGHTNGVNAVAWSPDGKYLASASDDNTAQVWNETTRKPPVVYRRHKDNVRDVAWSPDGRRIASASYDRTVQIWDAFTGNYILTYPGHRDWVFGVAWSPDGTYIASASKDQTIQVWDAHTGDKINEYDNHRDTVKHVAWSPDGKRIASASYDGTVQIWDALTSGNETTYTQFKGWILCVAWSPNGKYLAAGAGNTDHTMHVWDPVKGQTLRIYNGHDYGVNDVTWSPDGKFLITASDDTSVIIWQAPLV